MAWLKISGTEIDYPVMQAADNQWYLAHDYLNNYAVAGSLFLDYRNEADFRDEVSIIYGHRMARGLMFADIAKFASAEFLAEHSSGELITREGEHKLRFMKYLRLSEESGLYRHLGSEELGAWTDGRLLVLSTCSGEARGERQVLVAEIQ